MRNVTTILKISTTILKTNIINILFLLTSLGLFTVSDFSGNKLPQMIIFDVGQGDAILIQQDNYQILIDGGPDDRVVYELAQHMPWYDKTIEMVILTHPHDDHVRGLLNVLEEFSVEKILINMVEYENKGYQYILDNYAEKIEEVEEGDTFQYKDIYAKVLCPFKEKSIQEENINNESIVILLEVGKYKSLLMGDAEQEIERQLIKHHNLKNIYLLKVGHHCSRTSSLEMFLSVTKPELAICSCGERNKFGHPHYETIEKFQKLNVQYLITHREGNIVINFPDL